MKLPFWSLTLIKIDGLHDKVIQVYLKESIALKSSVDLWADRVSDQYENRALSTTITTGELQTPMTLDNIFPIRQGEKIEIKLAGTEHWIDLYEVSSKDADIIFSSLA